MTAIRSILMTLCIVTACKNGTADHGNPPDTDPADTDSGEPGEEGVGRIDECSDAPKEWVFCSGFEEGDFSIWDDYDGNPSSSNRLPEDTGPFNLAGNHVAQLMPPEGRGGVDVVKELPSSYDKLYTRWYVKWEPGFDFNTQNHGGGLAGGSRELLGRSGIKPDGTDYFIANVDYKPGDATLNFYAYYAGMYQDCLDPNGSCWGDTFPCVSGASYCNKPEHLPQVTLPVMETDRWFCIETMLDAGTPSAGEAGASGALNMYIDGQEIGPWPELWMRSVSDLKITILRLNLFHHGDHPLVGVRYDNVVVSTSRIGCPSTK